MSNFGVRLVEERRRLGLNQDEFGVLGGVSKYSQLAYEKGSRKPDTEYLQALAAHGVDVAYLLTGRHMPSVSAMTSRGQEGPGVIRELTPEQADLLDNYMNANESGRAAVRIVLEALAQTATKPN